MAVGGRVAAVVERGRRVPVSVVVQEPPGTDFDQGSDVTVVTEQSARVPVGEQAKAVLANDCATLDQSSEQAGVPVGTEQVACVEVAFAMRLTRALCKLPVVESGTEPPCHGLRKPRTVVAAKAVISETKSLRQHPSLSLVLGEKRFDAPFTVAAGGLDSRFEVEEGGKRQDGVTKFRILVLIDAPEALRISNADR